MHCSYQTPSSNNKKEDCTHGYHQLINTEIRLIIFFAAKDGKALYSQLKQDWELTVGQILNSLLWNSDLNWRNSNRSIPVEIFQILRDDAVKVLHAIYQQIWKIHQWPQDWKRSVLILVPNKGNAKNVQTAQFHSSHMLVKQCSKFSKPDFNSMWTVSFQMFKLDLEKAEEPEIKLPTSIGP